MKSKKNKKHNFDKKTINKLNETVKNVKSKMTKQEKRDVVKYWKKYEYKHINNFRKSTDQELISVFNSGVGVAAWVYARSIFLNCLKQEMLKRFDMSEIITEKLINDRIYISCSYSKKIYLIGKKVFRER